MSAAVARAYRVIHSCVTLEQLDVAEAYAFRAAATLPHSSPERHQRVLDDLLRSATHERQRLFERMYYGDWKKKENMK